ncbi:helix-turn-helix domain-containing protein [Flavobacterium sp. '19STA2R22 D10 B1']|uniref:helix-turn-helix domain-containing protein n=1 Tax=Flavobacterium aerium TaxID=3037261 RepID=UPI00278BF282|nr:AraC family transcriptional regulator [Flavobacterium sp. '19STA2R22 D10 B1']
MISQFKHHLSLSPEWQQQFVDGFGCTLIDNKYLIFPEEKANGSTCFLEVFEDKLSVMVIDAVAHESVEFIKIPVDKDYWVVYYDMSDEFSSYIIDKVSHKMGYQSKLGFGIVDCRMASSYIPSVGERLYSLRLLINKKFLNGFFKNNEFEEVFNEVFDSSKNTMFFYGHLDSKSKIVLHQIRERKFDEPSYEFLLKSVALNLLNCLIERLNLNKPITTQFSDNDMASIVKSQKYLLSNLLQPFPGIEILAQNSNMSVTKFKKVYKKVYRMNPGEFFKNEKLLLAMELLKSGQFSSISKVAFELGYNKPAYFTIVFKEHFKIMPADIFVSSAENE